MLRQTEIEGAKKGSRPVTITQQENIATHNSVKQQNTFMGLGIQRRDADVKRSAIKNLFQPSFNDKNRGANRPYEPTTGLNPLDMVS